VTDFAPRFTITNAIAAGLTAIERARGFLEAAVLSEKWVRRMSQRALLLEAHHTTHIEGSQLTTEQAERLWAGQPVAEARADDAQELLNYREPFNLVSDYLKSGEPVAEGLIREIHRCWSRACGAARADPGNRSVQNYVVNSRTRKIAYTPLPPCAAAPGGSTGSRSPDASSARGKLGEPCHAVTSS
jgi:Fic family protein